MSRPVPALPPLTHWIKDPTSAKIHPVASSGFSGARLWRIENGEQSYVLRQWPAGFQGGTNLRTIHQLQLRLMQRGLPVPTPLRTSIGETFVTADRRIWELAPWMPGVADYWQDPQPAKLEAALSTLAAIHDALAPLTHVPWDKVLEWLIPEQPARNSYGLPLAFEQRIPRLQSLREGELQQLKPVIDGMASGADKELASETLEMAATVLPFELKKTVRWSRTELPMSWRLRDIWHDHVLFTDGRVTGVIDFGAADIGSPAGDVARLLGSMVADDAQGWRLGVQAYESVRPLQPDERDAIAFFDSTGVLISSVNWLRWLFGDRAASNAAAYDRNAAIQRLRNLSARLRTLAATSRS